MTPRYTKEEALEVLRAWHERSALTRCPKVLI
jgi:hypothetical protein